MAKLEKARAALRCFEQEDRPSFGRWMAASFGALLTELRENSRLMREQQALIAEVEMEMILGNHHNPRKAYAAVMKQRENPDREEDFAGEKAGIDPAAGSRDPEGAHGDEGAAGDDFGSFEEIGAEIPREERQALFDDFARSVLGIDPMELGRAAYEQLFAEFETEMFGGGPQAGTPQVHAGKTPQANPDEARIKEIYRILVRRLHPDLRVDGDATVSAIWHDVQEAYEALNLDRLETLLALTEMENGGNGGLSSLSQIRRALEELHRAFQAIQRSLAEAKRDPAWGFSRNPYHGPLESRIRRELEESLDEQRWELADLKHLIDDWSRPWHPPVNKPRKQTKPGKTRVRPPGPESNIREPVQSEFW